MGPPFPTLSIAPGNEGSNSSSIVRTLTSKVNNLGSFKSTGGHLGGADQATAASDQPSFAAWLFGGRAAPPPPSVEDVASTFFAVKGRSREAHAAVGRRRGVGGGQGGGGDGNNSSRSAARGSRIGGSVSGKGDNKRKVASPWRPGAAAVSPGLGLAEERGG